jgi:hypothetical protein
MTDKRMARYHERQSEKFMLESGAPHLQGRLPGDANWIAHPAELSAARVWTPARQLNHTAASSSLSVRPHEMRALLEMVNTGYDTSIIEPTLQRRASHGRGPVVYPDIGADRTYIATTPKSLARNVSTPFSQGKAPLINGSIRKGDAGKFDEEIHPLDETRGLPPQQGYVSEIAY